MGVITMTRTTGVDDRVPTEILRYQSPADRTCQETSTAWDSQLIGGGGEEEEGGPRPRRRRTNEYSYNENLTVFTTSSALTAKR
jgi:hypothetical protein